MLNIKYVVLALGFAAAIASGPIWAAEPASKAELKIDVPVQLKASKIVFNMDRLSFAGDQSVGLTHMTLVLQSYRANNTPLQIIAVFHGMAGYMLLDDAAYNKVRRSEKGNPFKDQILALQKVGVQFEECAQTAKTNGWVNADLISGVKVNSGANLRLVELMQDGYVSLRP